LVSNTIIGWDIGGAHLKAAQINVDGGVDRVFQEPCPLWLGLEQLEGALDRILGAIISGPVLHAITMTGELADHFSSREQGVLALTMAMVRRLGAGCVMVFAGQDGFIPAERLQLADTRQVASANWLASGLWSASRMQEGLFIDIGSTTTDLLPISDHAVANRGYTDSERMGYDELLYSGVTRTPAMMLAKRVPLEGGWARVMAEVFASAADVYRLTGELHEYVDQMPAADHGPKTIEGSQRRLARQFGWDADDLPARGWQELAGYLRERQLMALRDAAEIQLSRGLLGAAAPLIGAGIGRFLVRVLAERLQRDYVDFSELFVMSPKGGVFDIADCGPATAVGCLAHKEAGGG
jgi:(4-(4-[2-(gamma-L-glutamylamino)ethyl]phenoxymethyl)furan-2-yl)methanamine synthase